MRWLCVLGVIALDRTPLSYAVCIAGSLSNIVPFWFVDRFTTRHLRLLGWILLLLDAMALSLASVPMVEKRNFPLLLLLLFFEASIPLGFEPPWLSSAGMAGITLVTVGYGYVAARFGDSVAGHHPLGLLLSLSRHPGRAPRPRPLAVSSATLERGWRIFAAARRNNRRIG